MKQTPEFDVQFARDPFLWPKYPILPLKRRDMDAMAIPSDERLGFISNDLQPKVYIGMIYRLKTGDLEDQLRYWPCTFEYKTLEDLFAEWEID